MSDSDSDYEGEQKELDLSNSDVVTKYKAAADIANDALKAVVAAAKPGARIVELCEKGDAAITAAIGKVFKGKAIEKGVAFPTCVSVNSVVGHFCPVSADDATELKEGDVAKLDLGVHIDGFIATEATTVVVQSDADAAVTGRAADVVQAAATALEAALRLMRPGRKISEVAEPLQKIAAAYGCQMVEGVLSHQMKQFVIDANKCVLNRPSSEARVEDGEFEENEVYAVDIVVSTGEGKTRVLDEKETAVYKRALEEQYKLKMKASRALFSEVNKKFPTMPFALRAVDAEQKRFGLVECINHGLLHPYPVLHEKTGELVAQFKATVLLMPNGSDRVTTAAPTQKLETDKKVEDEDILKLLATGLKSKSKKKSAKKKAKAAGKAEGEAAAAPAAAET
jgi:curved DNA binding protein